MAPKRKTDAIGDGHHQPERAVRRKVAHGEGKDGVLPLVHHASHGKVPAHLFVMGDGDCGQLGLGEDVTERLRPAPLALGARRVLQVVAGGMHTAALTEDHAVHSWGVNDEGALGRETAGAAWEKSAEATGRAGDSYTPGPVALPAAAGRVVQLSAGDSHTAALTERGAVWAWGTFRDGSGVMGFSPRVRLQLTPACVHAPARAADAAVRLASGADHVAALTADGRVLTWGSGQQGQLGRVGERLSDRAKLATLLTPAAVPLRGGAGRVVDVACGTYCTFAVTAAGRVYAWGLNNYGQLGVPGGAPMLFAPARVRALDGAGAASVRPGQHHTLVVTAAGGLLSFGRPTYGRLGRRAADAASDAPCPEVAPVDGLDGVRVAGAAAGLAVSGCFSADGAAFTWGFGTSNQLGKGDDDDDELVPRKLAETKVFQGQRVVALEFGGQHVCLLGVPRHGEAQD